MNLIRNGSRDRFTAYAGLGIVACILLIGRGVPAWVAWHKAALDADARTATELLQSRMAVRQAGLFDSVRSARARKLRTLIRIFLRGETVALASASLTDVLNDAASEANVTLGAVQVHADEKAESGIRVFHARGDMNGDVAGMMQFAAYLEGSLPVISIRRFVISASDPGAAGDHAESIHTEFVIDALARVAADSLTSPRQQIPPVKSTATLPLQLEIPRDRVVNGIDADELMHAADSVSASDPFRLARHPSSVPFGAPALPAIPVTPARARPVLVLGGIVGGPPWRALVAGVPGREGSVVLVTGDTIGGLKVRSVGPREVVVASPDTVWKLRVKQ